MEYCLHKVLQTELLQRPSPEHMLAYCQLDAQKQKSHLVKWQCRPSVCCYTFGIINRNSSHYDVAQFSVLQGTVYPKKYAYGFVVLCFVVVMQSFIINSYEVFIHIHQGCFAGTGAIVRLPQCQWSKPDGYGKISQCITTTKHSKAVTVCIFLGIYCLYSDIY